jgi:hypothetical protein
MDLFKKEEMLTFFERNNNRFGNSQGMEFNIFYPLRL